MHLKINLATRTYINTGLLNVAVVALIVIFGVALLFQVREAASNAGEMKRLSHETAALPGSEKGEFSEKEYQAVLARIHFANDIIARKTFNWLDLLDRLEGVVPDGVTFSAIEPELKGKSLKLTGVALDFLKLRQLMENLEGSNFFSDVYLENQSDIQVVGNKKAIGFSISCRVNY